MSIAPYAKAVVGGVIMGVTAAVPLVDDGLSVKDGLIIFLAAVAGFNGVYWTPNKDRRALHQQESVQPPTA